MKKWPVKEFMADAAPFLFDAAKLVPEPKNIFRVFNETSPDNIRVVIVGADPYPQVRGDGAFVATGRAFAVEADQPLQPSLSVIMDELATNYYCNPTLEDYEIDRTLGSWQDQGILLLNCSLTCERFRPEGYDELFIAGTHSHYWRVNLMEKLFRWMSDNMSGIIFVFLGQKAQYYAQFISEVSHHIIKEAHPAADAHQGKNIFRGSHVFNQINKLITSINGKEEEIRFLGPT